MRCHSGGAARALGAVLCAVLVAAASAAAVRQQAACYLGCRFVFCEGGSRYQLYKPGAVFTGGICARGARVSVGLVTQSGEALVVGRGGLRLPALTPISRWRPRGLREPFAPSFFRACARLADVAGARFPTGNSGVVREKCAANQMDFVERTCFALPFLAWEQRPKGTPEAANVKKTSTDPADCVAFEVIA